MNRETTANQLDTSDIKTAGPAEEIEGTGKAASGMSLVSASVESTASAVSSTDNPIALIDWMSSFLKILFNGVVDQISTVSVTLHPTSLSRMLIQPLD